MSALSVGEALREADTQVQALSFEVASFHADGQVAGWGPFLDAAAAAAANLPGTGLSDDLTPLVTSWRRWNRRTSSAPADARLAVATDALATVASLTAGRDLRGAPDLAQVSGHLAAIVCIGAHATAASIRSYLNETFAVSQNKPGLLSTLDVTSQVPRSALTRLVELVTRAEEVTLTSLSQAGQLSTAATPPLIVDRVDAASTRWAHLAQSVLAGPDPSLTDLRTIARTEARVAMAHAHLTRIAVEVQALTPDQHLELQPQLETASRAWSAAARDWHPAMNSGSQAHSRQLAQASTELAQAWASITSPGQHWATGAQIAAHHDIGELLEYAAHAHRRASLTARDYTAAAEQLLATGGVTVPTKLAQAFTGSPSPASRVPVTTAYTDRASFGAGRLTSAAESARIAFDTAILHSPAAAAARARLPLQMAAPDLDAAIRRRVDTLTQQRAHRAATEPAKPAQTRTTKPHDHRTDRPDDPQPGPRLR